MTDLAEYCRPVAFVVTQERYHYDYYEYSAVVRARSATEACLMAIAGKTDLEGVSDFPETDTIKDCELSAQRAPGWDHIEYSERAAYDMGWQVPCGGCGNRISVDDESEDDEGEPIEHIIEAHEVYCDKDCAEREQERRAAMKWERAKHTLCAIQIGGKP